MLLIFIAVDFISGKDSLSVDKGPYSQATSNMYCFTQLKIWFKLKNMGKPMIMPRQYPISQKRRWRRKMHLLLILEGDKQIFWKRFSWFFMIIFQRLEKWNFKNCWKIQYATSDRWMEQYFYWWHRYFQFQ